MPMRLMPHLLDPYQHVNTDHPANACVSHVSLIFAYNKEAKRKQEQKYSRKEGEVEHTLIFRVRQSAQALPYFLFLIRLCSAVRRLGWKTSRRFMKRSWIRSSKGGGGGRSGSCLGSWFRSRSRSGLSSASGRVFVAAGATSPAALAPPYRGREASALTLGKVLPSGTMSLSGDLKAC